MPLKNNILHIVLPRLTLRDNYTILVSTAAKFQADKILDFLIQYLVV